MPTDTELRVHRDWIGPLQPVGLVVSPPALIAAQAFPDQNILKEQQVLLSLLEAADPKPSEVSPLPAKQARKLPSFVALAHEVLGWKPGKLAGAPGGPALPEELEIVLPESHETLRPTYAVPALKEDDAEWMMIVQELPDGTSLDNPPEESSKNWHASPQVRLERLLRETDVSIGVLTNGYSVRLVYAPRGESSGHVTWPVYALGEVAGRRLLSALCMLLGSARLFTLPREQRLPHILRESRKYQNVVSTKLAGQVLEALNELLRGFQAANEAAKGKLLDGTVRDDPDHVYGGLLAVLLRLVFILYAEERGLLSSSASYVRNYSLGGLFEKLRADVGRFPDTMDQRYGAWSRLLVLFRMVHDGARRSDLQLPPRYGNLFDPDGWAFLEGRPYRIKRVMGAPVEVPKVPDGVVLRVLEKLLMLDGDRLSYRALDVEQIGSVYENMMGFRLERALETSIGVGKEHVVIGLETLLKHKGSAREKYLKGTAGVELSGKSAEALNQATSIDDLIAALSRRISPLTPHPVPMGGLYLQPTDERRRSGSHYTPRELTEPIVRMTLRPILENLGLTPKPEQILSLKVCDPAMGSGAFLVETCRQLAELLVKTYDVHGRPTDVPPDEDILLYAQRQVAQHCLYGVDKNPFAVDLGKLSLWLSTLAREHAFTFLDHSIRHGDTLVGLSREQISSFHWTPDNQVPLIHTAAEEAIAEAVSLRKKIQNLASSDDVSEKRQLLRDADDALARVRIVGDSIVASFFSEDKPKAREDTRRQLETKVQNWLSGRGAAKEVTSIVDELRSADKPVPCFHWEIEFPEVFEAGHRGFDAIIGNPPFLGGNQISTVFGMPYFAYLAHMYPDAGGVCDFVAYFFRRAFSLLRANGSFGLLATKTICKGETRTGGLRWIRQNGGQIWNARRRVSWPGSASVLVSVIHVVRGQLPRGITPSIDGKSVPSISSYLVPGMMDDVPAPIPGQNALFSQGTNPRGKGFVICDDDPECTPLSALEEIRQNRNEARRVLPYLSGEEINGDPRQDSTRWIICVDDISTEEELRALPHLYSILAKKVRPERLQLGDNPNNDKLKRRWWSFHADRTDFYASIRKKLRCLVNTQVSNKVIFAFQPTDRVFALTLNIYDLDHDADFAVLQSRVHEIWAQFFGSYMKDDLRYTPSTCFENFPFPISCRENDRLSSAGRNYNGFRASLLSERDTRSRLMGGLEPEGLTAAYNRFHDPEETSAGILQLRELHDTMDRAVLDAYGWTDIQPTCEFLLDYEEDEDDNDSASARRKKKPWRYRWPDYVRDEVLARLLELNAQRVKEEVGSNPSHNLPRAGGTGAKSRGRGKGAKKLAKSQGKLFGGEHE